MSLIWVRTGNAGTDPQVSINDLGIIIPTGTAWTKLSAGSSADPDDDGYGQFSSRELRDSVDLYNLITTSALEFSLDGLVTSTITWVADLPLMQDFTDDHFNLSAGRLTLPGDTNPPGTIASPQPGDLFYDTDDGYLVFYSGVTSQWVTITDSGVTTDHGVLTGLLDDDHSQYGLLAGNSARNAIAGTYNFADGYLIAPTYPSPPAVNVVDGEMFYSNGILYVYDGTRAKWLSTDRQKILSGKKKKAKDVYLRTVNGISSLETGIPALRNGTIVGIGIQTDDPETWTFEIRKNNSVTVISSLASGGLTGAIDTTINVDFIAGDELQFYANTSGSSIKAPVAYVEIAWRV